MNKTLNSGEIVFQQFSLEVKRDRDNVRGSPTEVKFSKTLARAAAKWGYFQRSNGPSKWQNETVQPVSGRTAVFHQITLLESLQLKLFALFARKNCQTQFHLTERASLNGGT